MSDKPMRRKFRCKTGGVSCWWTIGKRTGGFGAIGLRSATKHFPTCFLPFWMSNAVVNGPAFSTLDEAEHFVRTLHPNW